MVEIWDLNKRKCVKVIKAGADTVNDVKFSRDGMIAMASEQGRTFLAVFLRDKVAYPSLQLTDPVERVFFSADSKTLRYMFRFPTVVWSWRLYTGDRKLDGEIPFSNSQRIGFNADGTKYFATVDSSGNIAGRIYVRGNVEIGRVSQKKHWTLPTIAPDRAAMSANGKWAAVSGVNYAKKSGKRLYSVETEIWRIE